MPKYAVMMPLGSKITLKGEMIMNPQDLGKQHVRQQIATAICNLEKQKGRAVELNELDLWASVNKKNDFGRKFKELAKKGKIPGVRHHKRGTNNHNSYTCK